MSKNGINLGRKLYKKIKCKNKKEINNQRIMQDIRAAAEAASHVSGTTLSHSYFNKPHYVITGK